MINIAVYEIVGYFGRSRIDGNRIEKR